MLISKAYARQNKAMHEAPRGYGTSSHKWVNTVFQIVMKSTYSSLLDYGCGSCCLRKGGKGKTSESEGLEAKFNKANRYVHYAEYDPAVKAKCALPRSTFDFVVCTDVLEHIEPECLDDVLAHIFSLTIKSAFFVISLKEANKFLPDGRNAHLLIHSREWWEKKIGEYFKDVFVIPKGRPAKEAVILGRKSK
jgi:predicted TPR repeat methyltransferase